MVRKFLKKMSFVGLILLTVFLPVGSAGALSEKLLRKYSNYQIYFYNVEQACVSAATTPGSGGASAPFTGGGEQWNGSCTAMTATREAWLEKQISGMQAASTSNGLPWELIAAQTIAESGGASSEVCPYNPLGLKGSGPSCDGRHRTFSSYEEAYDHYVNNIISVKKVKGMYPNDPYSAISYMQYGSGAPYAQCSKPEYLTNPNHSCYGHNIGDPTPSYVQNVSSIICGIQKWAKSKGIAISSVTWENYSPTGEYSTTTTETAETEGQSQQTTAGTGASYCNEGGKPSDSQSGDYETPEAGNLADFIKKWAWSDYAKGKTDRMPAYADYMDNVATYKGAMNGVDCGAFVANIMVASGWDPNYVQGGTAAQKNYLQQNWTQVSTDSLRIGDVGIRDGHVILYAGDIDGFNSKTVSASQNDRAPMAGADKNLNNYTWYRK